MTETKQRWSKKRFNINILLPATLARFNRNGRRWWSCGPSAYLQLGHRCSNPADD